ncbi:PAS domain-containing hybrid sensor histidine kinase/response regulator [Caballeronia calidae]|uniref:PAS domain-containing hybrid sensor histidine kinase/response regulator n=1 Tax=Caballeronia calidae TaxID=1777139 RepID=UPI001E3906A6|nr:PAS domain-containing hybrid sensor histidine kinase/response regulator [Caballeronia calidae]
MILLCLTAPSFSQAAEPVSHSGVPHPTADVHTDTKDAADVFKLDESERSYLRTLKPIVVGVIRASGDASLEAPEVAFAKIERSLGVTFEPRRFIDWARAAAAFQRGEIDMIVAPSAPGRLNYDMHAELQPLDLLIRRAVAQADEAQSPVTPAWNVTALRLLPVLIAFAAVLFVTLRALVRLQQEMTRRMETEQRLGTQLSFQQTMMEVVPYPLVAKDMENRYIAVNRAFEDALGIQRDDILGRTSLEVSPWGAEHSRVLHDLASVTLATGERQEVEVEFLDNENHSRHGLFWTGAFTASNGERAGVVGTMIDITDIRDAETRARQTERRLHDVTRSLPAVVFQLRRANDGTYSLPYIDGDTRQLLGLDVVALADDPIHALTHVHAEDSPRLLVEIETSARTLEPLHTEFRSTIAGVTRWIRADLVAHRDDDGAVVWSGYWADASVEHARAEELARARDTAEAASRAKDNFLAMMSHEIRTPMNGVLGLVEVLENTPLNPDQSQMLGMIQDSASALLQILDDLLDYSKIEAGRLTIEKTSIDLRELVDNAVGLLAGRAHEKGLRVRVDVAPEVAAIVRGDSVRLRQILFNLMSNAIKFTIKGEVALHVRAVEQRKSVQVIELCVQDTGIGIAPEAQQSLFEPFVQAETSTTRRFGGTGLGLTICNRLVELMGGTMSLRSEIGVGTAMTVRMTMPVERFNYQIEGLRGKRGIVAIDDDRVGAALMHYGDALGLELQRFAPAELAQSAPELLDDIDIVFLGDAHKRAVSAGSCVIHLTEKPKPTGYRILENDIRVSVNPISWHGLMAACVAAMTGMPQIASGAALLHETKMAAPDREDALRSGKLVLVAEDHPVNQELIRHQLSLLGFACDVVHDGAEALVALADTRYGFLITDCHMPHVTGYELARRIRADEAGTARRLPILGITASTAPDELRRCREAGMDDCLVKPTRLAMLREHLNRWWAAASAIPDLDAHASQVIAAQPRDDDELDLSAMAQLWGSEATVKALLDAFVSSFREDLVALRHLLDRGTVDDLREWHHRVVGAASVLQYRPLLTALEQFRRDLHVKTRDARRREGLALIERCEQLVERIDAQGATML